MPALTHGRVYNDFRSGIEHIKDQNGNTKAILRRSLRPLPGLMKTQTHLLPKETSGTSAAVKRAWAKRSRYSASQNRQRDPEGALIYKSEKACPGPGNRNPFPPQSPTGT